MRTDHVIHRIHVQRLLLAAALFGLSLSASAVAVRGHDVRTGQAVWDAAVNGKSTVIADGNGGVRVMQAYKPSTVDANGNVALKTGGNAPVNGKSVPVEVTGTISKGDIANAAVAAAGCAVGGGGVVGAVICGGVALAIPIAMNWMANAGVRVNPTTKELEKLDSNWSQSDGYSYRVSDHTNSGSWPFMPTASAACIDAIPRMNVYNMTWAFKSLGPAYGGNPTCVYGRTDPTTGQALSDFSRVLAKGAANANCPAGQWYGGSGSCSSTAGGWSAASLSDAVGLMNNSRIPNADIVRELDAAGQSAAMQPQSGTVAVTGPASVQGPTTTNVTSNSTTNSTTTNTSTTNNYTYNNNIVTNVSTVTNSSSSVSVKNPDGTTTTTPGADSTETTTHGEEVDTKPEDPPTQCDKFPNSLGCAELDTPSGEIPRETKTITFEAEDVLGGGQCPADVMTTLSTLDGLSVKIIDWTTFCGMALPLRALVMALASIMAFFIIMPGGVRE